MMLSHESQLYFVCILAPLHLLYWHGPDLGGYGMWAGAEHADACTRLTSVPAQHWREAGAPECEMLLERRFIAFAIGAQALVGGLAVYKLLSACMYRRYVLQPALREMALVWQARVKEGA